MEKIEDFHPSILNAPKQKYFFNLQHRFLNPKKIIRKFYLSEGYKNNENEEITYLFFRTENINKNNSSYDTDTSSD